MNETVTKCGQTAVLIVIERVKTALCPARNALDIWDLSTQPAWKTIAQGLWQTPLVVRQRAKYCLDSKLKHTGQAQIQSMLVMVYLWEATLKIAHGRTGPVVKQTQLWGMLCMPDWVGVGRNRGVAPKVTLPYSSYRCTVKFDNSGFLLFLSAGVGAGWGGGE